jgi:hypothetical protein
LVAVGTTIGLNQCITAQELPPQEGMEVLTRGPVHEAFAETILFDPEPGIEVATAPPEPIEEIAPDQRPAGENVAWIPGYWGWDDERNDFLWVSGIWRALPPGRQWVPGYWGQSPQGFQWTSGYWADAEAKQIDYLPEPPATVEAGPNIDAPSADEIWLPGCWIWQQNRYAWRPGYWTQGNQNWDWVPDHYVWTPRGYVFVDGYYDYSVPRRGVVFAPVYFQRSLYTQRGFSYSPSTVINPGMFVRHLFLRPGYGHYYFGDYYGSNYANAGFSPWFAFQSSRRGYDPIYANQRFQHRRDRGWEQQAQANFQHLRENENARPPHNLAGQIALAQRGGTSRGSDFTVAAPLDKLAQSKDSRLRFQAVDPAERQQFGQRGQAYRKYLQQRQRLEADAARTSGGDPALAAEPARRPFSRSPFVAPPAEQLGKDNGPPRRHEVLKPDLSVQPQPRVRGGTPGTLPRSRQGTAGSAQVDPQTQQQRQRLNQGSRQGESADQSQQGQGANRGGNRQGASEGQSQQGQGASRGGNRQGASEGQSQQGQGASGGSNQQGASSGQQQGSSQNESKNKKKQ